MRNIVLTLAVMAATLLIFFVYRISTIYLADSVVYTPRSWLEYQLLAPQEIKKAPFILPNTLIHFRNREGNSPQIDEVDITDKYDVIDVENYLLQQNYHQTNDSVYGKIWISADGKRKALITETERSTKLIFTD